MELNRNRRNSSNANRSSLSYQRLEKRCLLASIGNGEEIIDDIEVGELVEYDFQVDAPGTVRIAMAQESGTGFARILLEVFDSNDNLVQSSNDDNSTALVTFDAPQAELYKIVFSDVDNDHALGFRARAASFSSELMLIEGRDKVLRNGIAEWAFTPSGSFTIFPLEVPDSGMVRISTLDRSSIGGRPPDMILYGPDGQRIETIDARLGEDSTVEFNPTETQTVTAVVFNTSAADYVRAVVLPGDLKLDAGSPDSFLDNGEEISRFLVEGQFALLHFVVNQADQVRFNVSDHLQNGSPILKVYSSDGTLVGSDYQDGTHATVKFTAAESGVFTAIVSDHGADTDTSFLARMAIVPGTPQLITSDAVLEPGVEVLTSTPKFGFRIFPLHVASAGQVDFELSGITSRSFALLEVYDSDGDLVASGGSQNATRLEVDFMASGSETYTAFVSALSLSSGTADGSMGFTIEANFNGGNFVVGRHAYFNNSFYDGDTTYYSSNDDDAAATGKRALLPGQTATRANYTNYDKGINGVFIDVNGLANPSQLSTDDIVLRTGNGNNVSDFNLLNLTPTIGSRSGDGNGGSDRIAIILPDFAVTNEWLQVTLLANATTGLTVDDQFYFGNSIGDVFNSFESARVNLVDVGQVRVNQTGLNGGSTRSYYDINRDGRTNLVDVGITRSNQSGFSGLNLITAPDGTGNKTRTVDSKPNFDSTSRVPTNSRLNPRVDDFRARSRWFAASPSKLEAGLSRSVVSRTGTVGLDTGYQFDSSRNNRQVGSFVTDNFFANFGKFESSII
jgi:hypothetical protein